MNGPAPETPNAAEIAAFFATVRPQGLLTLCAILPDGETTTDTFDLPADRSKATEWARRANLSGRNVYWTANVTRDPVKKKPTKADIARAVTAWSDIDPEKGRPYDEARAALLNGRLEALSSLPQPPTLIVDSGHGLQPLWLLTDGVDAQEQAEALVRRIEKATGANGTHNVDRLLRVPGTWNFPNAAKLKRGYPKQPTRASVLKEHSAGETYAFADLDKAFPAIEPEQPTKPPARASALTQTDAAVLEKARSASNGAKFDRLYAGDWDGYDSPSEADLALLTLLAFWTRDEAQLDRLFRGSGLMRAKWEREDYPGRTIAAALETCTETYDWTPRPQVVIGGGPPSVVTPADSTDPLAWTERFMLTEDEANALKEPDYLYEDLIIRGHVIAIVGEPNAGKSTVMIHEVCPEMVKAGVQVFYVHADTSGGDAKALIQAAKRYGYKLLTPDLKGGGLTMQDVISSLAGMAQQQGADYSDVVFVLDTLKKCTDIINKSQAKEFLRLLRQLSGLGMTLVLLAHTNKYKDADGRPVYEGTGDLRSDSDELIYLLPTKNPDQSMTISTDPDAPTAKKRGNHKPITFTISPERIVTRQAEYVDVLKEKREAEQFESDLDIIEAIHLGIGAGKNQTRELIKYCRTEHEISKRQVERCLGVYSNPKHSRQQWVKRRGFEHNAVHFYQLGAAQSAA